MSTPTRSTRRSRLPRRARFPEITLPGVVLIAVAALVAGCAGQKPPRVIPRQAGWTETGDASWYGPGYHGRPTASGERYDMDALTAAHRTLPFGTRVRVRNLDNGREVEVQINDRGPFIDGRIIDLSRAAAEWIGMRISGIAPVLLTVLPSTPGERAAAGCNWVQVGAFAESSNVRRAVERLRRDGQQAETRSRGNLTLVLAGPYRDRDDAEDVRARHGGILKPCGAAADAGRR